jgi:rubrerythrin
MRLTRLLVRMLEPDEHQTIRECRHCGQPVDLGTEECPSCGSTEVAEYDLFAE